MEKFTPLSPLRSRARAGISLIELLLVIAVIAMLATIIVPLSGRMALNAQQVNCAQNLRGIGGAIHLYTLDNDGLLPGPTYFSQKAGPDDRHFLANYLRPYLGDADERWRSPVLQFRCPSNENAESSYLATHEIRTEIGGGVLTPWGLVSGSGGRSKEPMRLAEVERHYGLSGQWALRDAYGTPALYRPWTTTPAGPVRHVRTNVLFFDGHVVAE